MKLYLINIYEAQMASEQGITAVCHKLTNTMYYKSEILEEAEVELPEDFTIEKTQGGGEEIFKGNDGADMVTEQRNGCYVTSLVTSDGIVTLHKWKY